MVDSQPSLAKRVIETFGGASKTARAIGAPVTTVHSWLGTGTIPRWRKPQIAAAAERLEKTLPKDFDADAAA